MRYESSVDTSISWNSEVEVSGIVEPSGVHHSLVFGTPELPHQLRPSVSILLLVHIFEYPTVSEISGTLESPYFHSFLEVSVVFNILIPGSICGINSDSDIEGIVTYTSRNTCAIGFPCITLSYLYFWNISTFGM